MSDQTFVDSVLEKYPDNCIALQDEIRNLKRKLEVDEEENNAKV